MAGRQRLTEADLKARPRCWRPYELPEHELISGVVVRMPTPGAFNGSRLFIDTGDQILALAATEKSGHSVLARDLARRSVRVGDEITIESRGFQKTLDGARSYRLERVIC
jgi:hypothetical protein